MPTSRTSAAARPDAFRSWSGSADLLPRVVLHFHLSDSAIASGHGVVRPEHDGPTSLQQLRTWLAETGCRVTDRSGPRPRRPRCGRRLRDPAADARRPPRPAPGRGVPLRSGGPAHPRPRPLRPTRHTRTGRTTGPDRAAQPRPPGPSPPPGRHPRPLATPTTRTGHVRVPLTCTATSSSSPTRAPSPSAATPSPPTSGRCARPEPAREKAAA